MPRHDHNTAAAAIASSAISDHSHHHSIPLPSKHSLTHLTPALVPLLATFVSNTFQSEPLGLSIGLTDPQERHANIKYLCELALKREQEWGVSVTSICVKSNEESGDAEVVGCVVILLPTKDDNNHDQRHHEEEQDPHLSDAHRRLLAALEFGDHKAEQAHPGLNLSRVPELLFGAVHPSLRGPLLPLSPSSATPSIDMKTLKPLSLYQHLIQICESNLRTQGLGHLGIHSHSNDISASRKTEGWEVLVRVPYEEVPGTEGRAVKGGGLNVCYKRVV
ncbi:hypothetical protein HDV05_000617 [Chytridiales sp. JEL 0842]|nr:hypothetical protein HDV05_000617 [Chytridiales sp. JEL 0842]